MKSDHPYDFMFKENLGYGHGCTRQHSSRESGVPQVSVRGNGGVTGSPENGPGRSQSERARINSMGNLGGSASATTALGGLSPNRAIGIHSHPYPSLPNWLMLCIDGESLWKSRRVRPSCPLRAPSPPSPPTVSSLSERNTAHDTVQ